MKQFFKQKRKVKTKRRHRLSPERKMNQIW